MPSTSGSATSSTITSGVRSATRCIASARAARLLDFDVDDLERRPQEHAELRVVVDDEQADAAPQPAGRSLLGRRDERDGGTGSDLVFGLVDGDTVPAGPFRGVERLVGVGEERVLVRAVGERRDADGDGGQRLGPVERVDSLSEPLGCACRGVAVAAHYDGELVATDAEHFLSGTRLPLEDAGDGDEHAVAYGVSLRVVDLLELVEIDEREGDGSLPARGLLDERLEVLVEGTSVAEVGEGVSPSLCLALRELAPAREIAGRDVGERADEIVVEVELDVRGHDDEQYAEALAVGKQGHGGGGAARHAVRPVELDQLAAAGSRGSRLAVGAPNDARRLARPRIGLRVERRPGHPHRARAPARTRGRPRRGRRR